MLCQKPPLGQHAKLFHCHILHFRGALVTEATSFFGSGGGGFIGRECYSSSNYLKVNALIMKLLPLGGPRKHEPRYIDILWCLRLVHSAISTEFLIRPPFSMTPPNFNSIPKNETRPSIRVHTIHIDHPQREMQRLPAPAQAFACHPSPFTPQNFVGEAAGAKRPVGRVDVVQRQFAQRGRDAIQLIGGLQKGSEGSGALAWRLK